MSYPSNLPHLLWVGLMSPDHNLNAAPWLNITRELRNLGWRVSLVVVGPSGKQTYNGTEVFCISVPKIYFFGLTYFHLKLLQLIYQQRHEIDVVLFNQGSVSWLIPLRFLRILLRKSRPLFIMDTRSVHMPLQSKQGWKGLLRGYYMALMNQIANRWADGLTAITTMMVNTLKMPSKKVLGVWPSGVDLTLFSPARVNRQWPVANDPIRLVYIGTLEYERNIDSFCKAVKLANSEGMSFIFTIIGEGKQRSELETLASNSQGRIIVKPPVPHLEIPQILAKENIGVLPFPDEEKFRVSSPIKLFEYMAAGLPILASRIVCHTDVIGDHDIAFWAEQSDLDGFMLALRQLWSRRNCLCEMSIQAALLANDWTWHESAKKLDVALKKALNDSFH